MNSDALIEKIKKLFAMGQRTKNNDGSTNEAEAAAAMAMAQQLLTKYNLDIHTVMDKADTKAAAPGAGPREKQQVKRSAMYRWQRDFWRDLAEANFCFHWIVDTREERYGRTVRCKRHVILGSQVNVAVVMAMGDYLTEVMERLLPYENKDALGRSAISWREGCAVRLIERVQERLRKMKAEGVAGDGGCTALAVQDVHEKEYAANYDANYGAGAYARAKQRSAEYQQRQAERVKQEKEERARTLAGETPTQRATRERDEARAAAKQQAADARAWERYQRQQQREYTRRDLAAYARGSRAANDVNLDAQVKQ